MRIPRQLRKGRSCNFQCLEPRNLLAGDLVAHWRANELSVDHQDGDRVATWTDLTAGGAVATSIGSPVLVQTEFAERAFVRFDPSDLVDGFRIDRQANPVSDADAYSIAVVFATDQTQVGAAGNWFDSSALVDSNAQGFAFDWGISLNAAGQVATGMGAGFGTVPQSISSSGDSLADGSLHVAAIARDGSQLSLYIDGVLSATSESMSTAARHNSNVTIGMSPLETLGFSGLIGEVRFYDNALSAAEVDTLQNEVDAFYSNSVPVANNDAYTLFEDQPSFQDAATGVLANDLDADGDAITATLVQSPNHGTLVLNVDGGFSYVPAPDFFGTDSFTYTASDHRPSAPATVQLTVNNVYDPPVAVNDSYKLQPGDVLQIPGIVGLLANDINPEGATLSVVLEQDVTGGQLDLNADGSFRFEAADFFGVTQFSYRISDGTGLSEPGEVELIVNSAPVANDDTFEVFEDAVLQLTAADGILANDVDAEQDVLTALLVEAPVNGELVLSDDGSLLYTPFANFFGSDTFTYRIADQQENSRLATVNLDVVAINDEPIAQRDAFYTPVDQPLPLVNATSPLRNDADVDSSDLTITLMELPLNGDIATSPDGGLVYTPQPGFVGVDSFFYVASDGEVFSEMTEVSLFVGTAPVQLSEFMAASIGSLETRLRDEPDGRFRGDTSTPDWLEIRNLANADFDLGGFHLTDRASQADRWTFPPETYVPAESRLVVFASGSDIADARLDELGLLHTNFSIGIEPGYLAVSFPDGSAASELEYPQQFAGVSFGHTAELAPSGYLQTPSPGEVNSAALVGAVDRVSFSHERGYYESAIEVTLTVATPEASIRYTLDGSAPTAANGIDYVSPIAVSETTTLRVIAIKSNHVPSPVVTQSYLFLNDVFDQPFLPEGYPDRWANLPADYGTDPEVIGPENLFDDVYRDSIVDDLKTLPTLSLSFEIDDFFGDEGIYQNPLRTGDSAERPVSVEYFSADDDDPGFHLNSGVRVMGGSSRQPDIPKHSFRLEFREAYGAGELNYSLFDDTPFSDGVKDVFDELVVRVGFNNSWMHRHYYQGLRGEQPRDQWVRDMHSAMGQPAARGKYVHVYLNGMYWGIYNLHERPAAPYMEEYFGGDKDTEWNVINSNAAIDGELRPWTSVLSQAGRGLTSDEAYQAFEQEVDTVSLADYMLLNFYIGNTDWDGHNWISARRNTDDKWRFFAWDSEFAISLPPSNTAIGESAETQIINMDRTSVNSASGPSRLHARASQNAEYQMLFADRVHEHFFNGGTLTPETATQLFLTRSAEIDRAVVPESARWGDFRRDVNPGNWRSDQFDLFHRDEHYVNHRDFILERYLPVRTGIVLEQLKRRGLYPDVVAPIWNRQGGRVEDGFLLSMDATEGIIYYTTDGSDPRQSGGDVSTTAIEYRGEVALSRSATVKSRVLENGEWSALQSADFLVSTTPTSDSLRISEVHFHPADPSASEIAAGFTDADEFEFIELTNLSTAAVDLTDVQFIRVERNGDLEGVDFRFADSAVTELGAGESLVVVENASAFAARYGTQLRVAGQWAGQLGNQSEQITLAVGERISQQFVYEDEWYPQTDGAGASLEIASLAAAIESWNSASAWRPSQAAGGSPATENSTAGDGPIGDSNRDGIFDSSDLVLIFQAGEYEDDVIGNSTWEDGDWNGDGEFNTRDFVFAFEAGTFVAEARLNRLMRS